MGICAVFWVGPPRTAVFLFGFPLHPPNKGPPKRRAAHVSEVLGFRTTQKRVPSTTQGPKLEGSFLGVSLVKPGRDRSCFLFFGFLTVANQDQPPPRWPVFGVPGEVPAIGQHLLKNAFVVT